MQRQRDLCFQCQRGMAAGEHQLQAVIRNCVFHFRFLLRSDERVIENFYFSLPFGRAAQAINGATFCNGQQPRTWVAWNAVNLPAFECIDQGILQRVLRQFEILKLADQRCKDATMFFAEGLFDLLRCGHFHSPSSLFSRTICHELPSNSKIELREEQGLLDNTFFYISDHSGRISIEPSVADGIFAAQRRASSRSLQSSRKNPPNCSCVSAKGPSVMSALPSRTRTVVALATGLSPLLDTNTPPAFISSIKAYQFSGAWACCSSGVCGPFDSSAYISSMYFILFSCLINYRLICLAT